MTLGFGRSPDPVEDSHLADLGILAGQIGVEALDVSDEADAPVRALNDAVVDRVAGQAVRGSTGLSIYFPSRAEYFDATYSEVGAAERWAAFLAGYYAAGEALPAEAQPRFLGDPDASFDVDGLTLVGGVDPAAAGAASEATISYGLADPDGTVTFYGEEPATVGDDGRVLGIYDLSTLTISDGEDTAQAYLTLTEGPGGGYGIDVPMAYYAPGAAGNQDVLLSLTVDGAGDIVNETNYAYHEDLGTRADRRPGRDRGAGGAHGRRGRRAAVDADHRRRPLRRPAGPAVRPAPLPSGSTLYAEPTVTDFAGNIDTVTVTATATVTVP